MTKYYLVDTDSKEVEHVIDDASREIKIHHDCHVVEWTWQYKIETEDDIDWVDADDESGIPDGVDRRICEREYKDGAHFKGSIGYTIENPSAKDIAEIWAGIVQSWNTPRKEACQHRCLTSDNHHVFAEGDFIDGQWMGDESQWEQDGFREKITGYVYEGEDYLPDAQEQ